VIPGVIFSHLFLWVDTHQEQNREIDSLGLFQDSSPKRLATKPLNRVAGLSVNEKRMCGYLLL